VPGQKCSKFGIHNRFLFLKQLYDKKQAGFISNVGNLVEPWGPGTRRCVGMYSHSDQQIGAQTNVCQQAGSVAMGGGGRIGDELARKGFHTESFSLSGKVIWSKGFTTSRQIVDSRGTTQIDGYDAWRETMINITEQQHGNGYAEAYTQAFLDSVHSIQTLGRVLEGAALKTRYPTNSGLNKAFQRVARLIGAREARKAERDLFFISIGGWDMHSNMKAGLTRQFENIDASLKAFVTEMQAQGIWRSVVLLTESEFARTLDSNGGGSDHAWGGQQFIISGALNGGKLFTKYPSSMAKGNKRDLGRGRLIPDYPWETVLTPISEWLGLSRAETESAFPNLKNFNSTHIISRSDLFSS